MTAPVATSLKDAREAAAEVTRCLREALRDPAFAAALVLLLSGKELEERCDLPESPAPGASAESGEERHE